MINWMYTFCTFSMPDIPATKKQCMSCTESKRLNSIYSWWVKKKPIESYSGEWKSKAFKK
jgi:hypothetical protein